MKFYPTVIAGVAGFGGRFLAIFGTREVEKWVKSGRNGTDIRHEVEIFLFQRSLFPGIRINFRLSS